jgi:hypothetical protein
MSPAVFIPVWYSSCVDIRGSKPTVCFPGASRGSCHRPFVSVLSISGLGSLHFVYGTAGVNRAGIRDGVALGHCHAAAVVQDQPGGAAGFEAAEEGLAYEGAPESGEPRPKALRSSPEAWTQGRQASLESQAACASGGRLTPAMAPRPSVDGFVLSRPNTSTNSSASFAAAPL